MMLPPPGDRYSPLSSPLSFYVVLSSWDHLRCTSPPDNSIHRPWESSELRSLGHQGKRHGEATPSAIPGPALAQVACEAQGLLTEAVLGADVGIFALHGITVAVRAGLDAGGAGGEVPGDSYDIQQAGYHHKGALTLSRPLGQEGLHPRAPQANLAPSPTPLPARRNKLRPEQNHHARSPTSRHMPEESSRVLSVQGSPGGEARRGWADSGLHPASHQGGQER